MHILTIVKCMQLLHVLRARTRLGSPYSVVHFLVILTLCIQSILHVRANSWRAIRSELTATAILSASNYVQQVLFLVPPLPGGEGHATGGHEHTTETLELLRVLKGMQPSPQELLRVARGIQQAVKACHRSSSGQ